MPKDTFLNNNNRHGVPQKMRMLLDGEVYSPYENLGNDFFLDVAKGVYSEISSIFKFGYHDSISTTEEVIWDEGGNYVFLNVAEKINVSSSDADDVFGGSGAHDVLLYGLDSDFKEIQEYLQLDGTTSIQTQQSFIRLNRAHIVNSGSALPVGDSNLGDISFISEGTSELQAKILAGRGQTLMCVHTIPAGKTGFVTGISFGTGKGKDVTVIGKIRNGVGGAFSVKYLQSIYESTFVGDLKVPLKVTEKLDLVFVAKSSGAGTPVAASFGILLIDND